MILYLKWRLFGDFQKVPCPDYSETTRGAIQVNPRTIRQDRDRKLRGIAAQASESVSKIIREAIE